MDDAGVAGGQGRTARSVVENAVGFLIAAALVASAYALGAWLGHAAVAR